MESMYKRYAKVKPIVTKSFTYDFGIAIFAPDEVDRYKRNCDVITAWHGADGYRNFHKNKVHYTDKGRSYIRKGSIRIYLDEMG